MSLCNLIAIGTLPDGPARKLLLSGKGTALHKSPSGLRPIVTLVPCGQYTSHAIATEYKGQIQEICGDRQFMGVSHGCEIVSHLVRHQLEMDHSQVVIKVNVKNAFNEIDPDELPAILPYVLFLLAMSEVDIIFNDSRAGKISVHRMTTGVPQGGSLSSALFDMGIPPSIRRAQLAHPTASIYLIADDNMVVGPPAEAIATVKTITLILVDVGLTLAATTDSKNVIYGL